MWAGSGGQRAPLLRASSLTLGLSEEPVRTMSEEEPGKSSTRDGTSRNTSWPLEVRPALWPLSALLGWVSGGANTSPPLWFEEASVAQYKRRVRCP